MPRKTTLGAFAGAALLMLAAPALAFTPSATECIAPAAPGGGWDFTCRQIGKTLQDLKIIPGTMQVTNLTGGSGGVAFAEVTSKRDKDDNLIVAASSATAARLATGAFPRANMDQVRWVGSIGADYGVIAVAKNSPIKTLPELLAKIKTDPKSIAIAGGSAVGGWDHLKVLIAAKADGVSNLRAIKYVPFEGGGEAITQLLAGSVQAFSGDASEAKGFVDSGDVRVIAVLSPQRMAPPFDKFPTAKEQGVDAIGANWRGFYAPGHMSDDAYKFWVDAIQKAYVSPEWKTIMKQGGIEPLDLSGEKFQAFVKASIADIRSISKDIGLIK